MNSVTKPILLIHLFLSVIVAIDVTCDRVNPLIQSDVTCTCKNAPGTSIDWLIDDVFNSNCVLSSICAPQYSGYSYSMNTTENIYEMTINSYNYSYCTKMTCKDTSDGSIMQSIIPSSLVFDTTFPTSMTEPGSNNSNGIISVTTGCISGFSDVQYDWFFIVGGLEERYVVNDTNIIDTIENSPCVNCDTDVNGQRTIGFEHSEASGSGTKTGLFKVSLYHVSTNFQLNLTSRYFYTLKANKQIESDGDVLLCNTSCITGISLGIVLLLIIFIVTMVIVYYFVRPKFTKIDLKDTKIHLLWTDRLYCCRWCQLIFEYNIVCNPIKGQVKDKTCQKSTKENHCTLKNLDPMAIYKISLSRKFCCFKSSAPERYVITRKKSMLNDQEYHANATTIFVRWTKPDCISNLPLKYQVTCNKILQKKTDKTTHTLEDLIVCETYEIEVFAIYIGKSCLLLAEEITAAPIKMCLEDVCYEPVNVRVNSKIRWRVQYLDSPEFISRSGKVRVICRWKEEQDHRREVEITNSKYTITGLYLDRTYTVYVYAIYKSVKLEPPVKIKLKPYKPTNLKYTKKSTEIDVEWTRPEYTGSQQLQYLVTCDGDDVEEPSSTTACRITGLVPGKTYEIKIYTLINLMKSQPLVENITTSPSKPTNLTFNARSTQIELKWEKPEYASNQKIEYEVKYNKVVETTSNTSYKVESLDYRLEMFTVNKLTKESSVLEQKIRTQSSQYSNQKVQQEPLRGVK